MSLSKTSLQPLLVNQTRSVSGSLGVQQVGGHYRAFPTVAAVAPAANAVLFSFRWVATVLVAVPFKITAMVTAATAVTAQRLDPLVLTMARGYTVADNTNTTAVDIATNTNAQKARTSPFGTSVAQLQTASAAAGISGGTKTLDPQPCGAGPITGSLALGSNGGLVELYRGDQDIQGHPMILMSNEGFVVSWGPTALATGTVTVTIGVEWAETPKY